MSIRAQIVDGRVVNLIEVNPGAVPADLASWPEPPGDVAIGWEHDGTTFTAPAADLQALRAAAELPRKEFATRAATAGYVTFPEATAYAIGLAVPASVEAVILAQPAADQELIRHQVLTEDFVRRSGRAYAGLDRCIRRD